MKRHLQNMFFLLAFLAFVSVAGAQKKHFIYIQSEDKQPFYVMLNNKNYSSSLSGYLVIPKLKNGRYFFVAGFPKDLYPEQKFSCVVEDKDLGFSLKRFGDKGWGLFDYVSFKTIMANPNDWEKDKAIYDTVKLNTDEAFVPEHSKPAAKANEQAAVSTSKPQELATTEKTKPPVTAHVPVKTEVVPVATVPTTNTEVAMAQQEKKPIIKQVDEKINVVKTYDRGNSQGIDQVYIDYAPNRNDTIAIFIPYVDKNVAQTNNASSEQSIDTAKPKGVGSTDQYNRSCVNLASEADYNKARRLMSEETTDDRMIASAKQSYKNRCFTTEQVRTLGLLFLSEKNRYKFFVASKPFIYDVFNYASLETEFKLSVNIDQFRKSAN